MTFYKWLLMQGQRDDPIGDLAFDAQRDEDFPEDEMVLGRLLHHLELKFACEEAMGAMASAYKEYKHLWLGEK